MSLLIVAPTRARRNVSSRSRSVHVASVVRRVVAYEAVTQAVTQVRTLATTNGDIPPGIYGAVSMHAPIDYVLTAAREYFQVLRADTYKWPLAEAPGHAKWALFQVVRPQAPSPGGEHSC